MKNLANGGCNTDTPKVAKFLVILLMSCMNDLTMVQLSPRLTQRNWICREDAVF